MQQLDGLAHGRGGFGLAEQAAEVSTGFRSSLKPGFNLGNLSGGHARPARSSPPHMASLSWLSSAGQLLPWVQLWPGLASLG